MEWRLYEIWQGFLLMSEIVERSYLDDDGGEGRFSLANAVTKLAPWQNLSLLFSVFLISLCLVKSKHRKLAGSLVVRGLMSAIRPTHTSII